MPEFRENVPLKDYCTYSIGGPARYFEEIHTIDEMQQAIGFCHAKNLAFMV